MSGSWINPWLALLIAGALEVVWASGFKYVGTQRPLISVGVAITMAASFYFLWVATQKLPIGTAYAIWTGIGGGRVNPGDHPLAAGPEEDRKADLNQPVQMRRQGQVVGQGLAEADAGIEPDPLARHPRGHGRFGPGRQFGADLGDDVVVAGIGLHGLRLAAHMHEHDLAAQFGGGRQTVGREAEGRHIVPDRRPGRDGGAGDFGFHGVDADRAGPVAAQTLDDRNSAGDFLGGIDRFGPRPGAFTADVEDVRALFDQRQTVRHRRLDRGQPAAVREAVRRDIDDAHDLRTGHQSLPPIRLPMASR